MTEETARDEEPPAQETPEWRSDPAWRLVWYAADHYGAADAPERPTARAELAQPTIWATAYDGSRPVATWWRPSDSIATVVTE